MKRGLIVLLVLVVLVSACEYQNFINQVTPEEPILNVFHEMGSCVDKDLDGYCANEDCDDENENVNPGSVEVCSDGLDNDCKEGEQICMPRPDLGDDDYDGLSNNEEEKYGTSKEVQDSDGDGLSDREEVKIYLTNPLIFDSDGDGYCDGGEVYSGVNPLDGFSVPKDEDQDGLGDDWEIWSFESLTYHPENDVDVARARKRKGDGLTNLQEYCLGLKGFDADSDNDGLSDGEEVNLYLTDPKNKDTDGDGFYDGREVDEFRTDPLDPRDYAVFTMTKNLRRTQFTANKFEDGRHYANSYRRTALPYGQSVSVTGEIND